MRDAAVTPAMTMLACVGASVVRLFDVSGDVILRMLGYTPDPERKIAEEEVRTLIAEAENGECWNSTSAR